MDLADNTNMESTDMRSDDKSLFSIIETTGDVEALELLNSGRTFSQDELDMALLSACHRGYKSLVHELVHFGADIQVRDRDGNTPLLICADNGFIKIVKYFIRKKVDINTANNFGDTALILAVCPVGVAKLVNLLLAQTGINVSHQNTEGYTALMKAIEVLDIDAIKLLLNAQENALEVLEGIQNCRSETAQGMADKLGIGNLVKFLSQQSTKMYNPLLATIRTCDVESFNVLMDCRFYQSPDKKHIVQDCFLKIFSAHKKRRQNFSENEEKIIQRLLEFEANIHDYYYFNPVLIAIRVGNYNVLQMLLRHGIRLSGLSSKKLKHECEQDNMSGLKQKELLATSAEHGDTQIVKLLLKHNPKLATPEFITPALIGALKNGHTGCVKILTKHLNLDIMSIFESAVNSDDSVLLKCVRDFLRTRVKHILSRQEMSNFVVSAARAGHTDIIEILLDAGADVNAVNSEYKTPLMESKNADVVNFLVQRGADVNKYDKENNQFRSPLTYILSGYYFQPHSTDKEKIIEALLHHHASINGRSCGGRTPLMVAVLNRATNHNILQMLLDHGADVSLRDSKGNTVLHIAAEKESVKNMESLLQTTEARNIVNLQNDAGLTALMISASKQSHMTMKVLINHGADVDIKDFDGNTALLLAVPYRIKKSKIMKTLIQAGSDINVQNTCGFTPLMLAAQASLKNAVKLLVASGANVNVVSDKVKNATALTLILDNTSFKSACVRYLLDHGAKASYLKPDVLHRLIQQNNTQFIPKLLQSGLVPTEIATSNIQFSSIPVSVTGTVSPLCMALITGNVKLARYFVGNLFVTKSDVFTLFHSQNMRHHLVRTTHHKCVKFLKQLSAQPMSLFSLAFLSVQSAVGTHPGREERISVLPLSQVVKDKLLFKVQSVPWNRNDWCRAVNKRSTIVVN